MRCALFVTAENRNNSTGSATSPSTHSASGGSVRSAPGDASVGRGPEHEVLFFDDARLRRAARSRARTVTSQKLPAPPSFTTADWIRLDARGGHVEFERTRDRHPAADPHALRNAAISEPARRVAVGSERGRRYGRNEARPVPERWKRAVEAGGVGVDARREFRRARSREIGSVASGENPVSSSVGSALLISRYDADATRPASWSRPISAEESPRTSSRTSSVWVPRSGARAGARR